MPSDFRWHSFLVSAGYLPDTASHGKCIVQMADIWYDFQQMKQFVNDHLTSIGQIIEDGSTNKRKENVIKNEPIYYRKYIKNSKESKNGKIFC